MLGDRERQRRLERLARATEAAKKVLKKGDRLTITKCPGTKRWIIFGHWEGDEIISASGRREYAAINVSRVNGERVDFTRPSSRDRLPVASGWGVG
ncbi:MAG: hypothetical protein RJQ08_10915 [Salinisphaeraceae bacterium]